MKRRNTAECGSPVSSLRVAEYSMRVCFRIVLFLFLAVQLNGCSNSGDSSLAIRAVTGSVQVPPQLVAAMKNQHTGMLARMLDYFITTSQADISGNVGGFVPVSGVTVELIRLNYDPVNDIFYETVVPCDGGCPVTDVNGNFTIYTSAQASSDLTLKVSFIDPLGGASVVMRAIVYGDNVDVTPISEAATQLIMNSVGPSVSLSDFTVNEVGALVKMIEDEDIDLTGLNFTDAISKISTDAGDLLSGFVDGFQSPGEMNITFANDVFNILELRNRLIAPNVTFSVGALDYEATTGGAVSFDSNGNFQSGSALYYWGLRSVFSGSPVRLFDQALDELNPALSYGVPVGFQGITAADNGNAIASSDTEETTSGFVTNDGGLMALLSEHNDEGQSIYDRGLRVLMRKWKDQTDSYNDAFTNNTINVADGLNGYNTNSDGITSSVLNELMDFPGGGTTDYNIVMYQHYLNDGGIEVAAGTGLWNFDTASQVQVTGSGIASSDQFYGSVTVASQNLDAIQYQFSTSTLLQTAPKSLEPCPNLFAITYGGTMNLRRDISNPSCNGGSSYFFSGSGAVTSDGEVFVIPQVYDDSEDNVTLEYPMPAAASARRGWYVGVRQPATALTDANLSGVYHVVGQVTELADTTSTDSVTHQTFHGDLTFSGTGQVVGALHKKSSMLDDIDNDPVAPLLSRTPSVNESVIGGTYLTAPDGTFSITLPGTTETVTGVAGQMFNYNGNDYAMFLVVPIKRDASGSGARGIMLLAHEFLVDYPIPPDPPIP